MVRTLIAWLVFFGGFGIEIGVDRFLRMRDGEVRTGGIPEPLWFAIPIALSTVAALLAWHDLLSLPDGSLEVHYVPKGKTNEVRFTTGPVAEQALR